MRFDADIIGNREAKASDPLHVEKLHHLYRATERFGLGTAGTPVAADVPLFHASRSGEIGDDAFFSLVEAGSNTAITCDIKKNGTTILSTPIPFVHGDGDGSPETASFTSAAARQYVRGDVFSAVLAVSASTGAQGPMLTYERIESGD